MYLYIFEDGSLVQSSERPTAEDFQVIGDGILQVIKFQKEKFCEFDENGDLLEIPER